MGPLFIRDSAVEAMRPAADHSDSRGLLVEIDGNGKASVINSAADVPYGVILDGQDPTNNTNAQDSIAVLGGAIGTIPLVADGNIAKGAFVQAKNNGRVITDAAAGARVIVGRAMEAATQGEQFEAVGFNPVVFTS